MTNQAKRKIFILTTILLLCGFITTVQGQIKINSPYTRYGLGTLVDNGLDPRTTAMGGLHFGLQRNDLINPANPASYVAFDSLTFIFDAGIFGSLVNLRTDNINNQGSYISLSHLTFGFSISKWWKTSLGLLPFSYVGYDIFHTEELEGITKVTNVYLGSGGLNQIYWGNAFPIGKKLSVGFNLKYMFGSVDRSRGIAFPDSTEMMNTFILGSVRPRDIYGEIGIQYKTSLPKDHFFVAGAMFGPQTNINSKIFYLATTYYGNITAAQLKYDTIDFRKDDKGSFTLPVRIGLGATAGKARHWTAGADFSWQNWEKYTYDGQSDSLLNRWSVNLGGEYIPDARSNTYYKRASYRLGFHYGKTPINLKNRHIDEVGISFGVGLPIKRSRSTVNLSAIIGKRGTTQNGLIQENFFRFTVGVNALENWFIKSKYY